MNLYIGHTIEDISAQFAHVARMIRRDAPPLEMAEYFIRLGCRIDAGISEREELMQLLHHFLMREFLYRFKPCSSEALKLKENLDEATTLDQMMDAFKAAYQQKLKPTREAVVKLILALETTLPGILMEERVIEYQQRWVDSRVNLDWSSVASMKDGSIGFRERPVPGRCLVCETIYDPENKEARAKWMRDFQAKHGGLDD